MGIDAGFDMCPRLSKKSVDRQDWDRFISCVKNHYKGDKQVEMKGNYILFKAGEHPMLPFEGHKFLRFSSKISGSTARMTGVESYIETVAHLAKDHFGSRAQYWNECCDRFGVYTWQEVYESIESYEQADENKIGAMVASSPTEINAVEELDTTLFEIKPMAGKGRGLVARLDISKGTRILCEKPLFIASPLPLHALEKYIAAKLKALPKTLQRQFLSLHNSNPGQFPFSHTFKTNALPCGPDSHIGGVYPTICLINHSCIPNSQHNWDEKAQHETVYAMRPIKAGEEITICYDKVGTYEVRRAFLKQTFGFDCDCFGCSRLPSDLKESDNRRIMIQKLDDAIGDPFRMRFGPVESLRACKLLLQVLGKEFDGYAGILNARLYYDAFQISIAHGDQARASLFAEKSYQCRVVCEGENSPEAQRVKSLARKPSAHPSFGKCSKKWKTTMKMIAKDLGPVELHEWLFERVTT